MSEPENQIVESGKAEISSQSLLATAITEKIKVLALCDSPTTGFARAAWTILNRWASVIKLKGLIRLGHPATVARCMICGVPV